MANLGYGANADIATFRGDMSRAIGGTEFDTGVMIANAEAALDQWTRENAMDQINFNIFFANNVAGSRQSYLDAMRAAASYMGTVAIPSASQYHLQAEAIGARGKKNWLQIGLGVAALAASPFAGPAAGAVASAGGGLLKGGLGA